MVRNRKSRIIESHSRAIAESEEDLEKAVKNEEDMSAQLIVDELLTLAADMTLKALKAVKGKTAKELIAASAAAKFMACKLEWLASEYMEADVELVHRVENYLWQSIDISVRDEQENK